MRIGILAFLVVALAMSATPRSNAGTLEELNGPYTTNGCAEDEVRTYRDECAKVDDLLRENAQRALKLAGIVVPDCHEDEDYATVHHETRGAREDSHGVTRMCVARDSLVMEAINRLVKDGTLIWEWDLET